MAGAQSRTSGKAADRQHWEGCENAFRTAQHTVALQYCEQSSPCVQCRLFWLVLLALAANILSAQDANQRLVSVLRPEFLNSGIECAILFVAHPKHGQDVGAASREKGNDLHGKSVRTDHSYQAF